MSALTQRRRFLRSGTGPRKREVDGITANVTLIISKTDAMDPRTRGLRAPLLP